MKLNRINEAIVLKQSNYVKSQSSLKKANPDNSDKSFLSRRTTASSKRLDTENSSTRAQSQVSHYPNTYFDKAINKLSKNSKKSKNTVSSYKMHKRLEVPCIRNSVTPGMRDQTPLPKRLRLPKLCLESSKEARLCYENFSKRTPLHCDPSYKEKSLWILKDTSSLAKRLMQRIRCPSKMKSFCN